MEQHEDLSTQPTFTHASDQSTRPANPIPPPTIAALPIKKECAGGGDCKNCPLKQFSGELASSLEV